MLIDSDGNIDSKKLEREIQHALVEDINYKQTDNMKKRAVKVASSYDEFKAMVQCSNLKPLKRDEIESLKNVKKGWSTSKKRDATSGPTLLKDEEQRIIDSARSSTKVATKLGAPSNAFDLEKNWRILTGPEDKLRYLKNAGATVISPLVDKGDLVDIFEDILMLFTTDTPDLNAEDVVEWIFVMSQTKRFSRHFAFVSKSTKKRILFWCDRNKVPEELISKLKE